MGVDPLISVIVPVRNAQDTIHRAIVSIQEQTYRRCEVIVIDGGSKDTSVEVAKAGQQIALIELEDCSIATARNEGIARAHGEYIAFLDADDVWFREKLELQLNRIRGRPEIGLTYCNLEAITAGGERLGFRVRDPGRIRYPPSWQEMLLIPETQLYPSSVLARKQLVVEVGGFDKSFTEGYEDVDLFLRLRETTEFDYLDAALGEYRYDGSHDRWVARRSDLFRFARKYWNHPLVRKDRNGLREEFVHRCLLDLTGMMMHALKREKNVVSAQMLRILNDGHEAFKGVFGELYCRSTGLDSIDLDRYTLDPATSLLLYLYLLWPELQSSFPEVRSGNIRGLINWGAAEASRNLNDHETTSFLISYRDQLSLMASE